MTLLSGTGRLVALGRLETSDARDVHGVGAGPIEVEGTAAVPFHLSDSTRSVLVDPTDAELFGG